MAKKRERTTSFGRRVVLWERDGRREFVPLGEHCLLPIGDPLEDREIEQYAVGETGACARRFKDSGDVILVLKPHGHNSRVPEANDPKGIVTNGIQ